MKRVLPASVFFCLMYLGLSAQVEIEIISQPEYNLSADLSDFYAEPIAHSWVVNKSNSTIKLRWLLEVADECPDVWKYKVCDDNQCYSTNVTSNVVPGGQPNVPVLLAPGDTTIIDLHINPRGEVGCCVPVIKFSEVTNPNGEIQLGSLDYTTCISGASSVNEVALTTIQAFPNPTTGEFSISDNPLVKRINVYNLLGKQVASYQHVNGNRYDLAGNADGLYLVTLLGENGEAIKSMRLTKQVLRP